MNFAFFILLSVLGLQPAKDSPEVVIRNQHFKVELAKTNEEWRLGLMLREHLGRREGMLFLGRIEKIQSFWMKNTLIPLDIIYISKNRKVVSISHQAKPHDTTPLYSKGKAMHVLEIPGGEAKKIGIQAGDSVEFKNISGF